MTGDLPTAVEVAESVRRGERRAVDVLADALARIDAGNEALNAFVAIDRDLAEQAAAAVDADRGALATTPARSPASPSA